jgi:hypothetical protein
LAHVSVNPSLSIIKYRLRFWIDAEQKPLNGPWLTIDVPPQVADRPVQIIVSVALPVRIPALTEIHPIRAPIGAVQMSAFHTAASRGFCFREFLENDHKHNQHDQQCGKDESLFHFASILLISV